MSILSFLFPDRYEDDTDEQEEGQGTTRLPELYKGMVVDVILRDGKPLLTGQLTSIDPEGLVLERLPGQFSFDISPVGADVSIRGCNTQMLPFGIRGTVQESNRTRFSVKDIRPENFANQRHDFRLAMNTTVYLYHQQDERMENPEECILVDLSIGGACVQSEYMHGEGEILRLQCTLQGYAPIVFLGQVIRASEYTNGKYRYGILFAKMREEEVESLTRTLYNFQTNNRREWRQSKSGPWL